MAESGEELPDFLKLPRPLQEKFFTAVEEEVKDLVKTISRFSNSVNDVRQELSRGIRKFNPSDDWRGLSVAVVDGSDVPAVDDRIGLRYGLYAVAYKVFKGLDPVDGEENYFGDRLAGRISTSRDSFLKILDLITTYYERLIAAHLLQKKNIDLLIVDGSFFGYRAGCSMVKNEPLSWRDPVTEKQFTNVFELIKRINELTIDVLSSQRAVGIIKRVPTTAIDGYLCYRHGFDKGIELSDRSILSLVMRPREIFDYEDMFGPDLRYDVFSWFGPTARDVDLRKKGRDAVLRKAEKRVIVQLVADLTDWNRSAAGKWEEYAKDPVVTAARSTRRVFLRTVEDMPPVCVEFHQNISREMLDKAFSYIFATANPATGLPLPLDLVDELVSLPRGIGKEFINEIEAELVRRGLSKESLLAVFSRYNPQKDEL
ncbi:MAG: DNA double-strand break repair nuclease NurA [Candidatus Caldarchaeum sp.]|uniref:DNA double-strand break repair nuclease NurA n=1 Tax=Caldiarchaeum subterraneum TaxID=311458 RepID=A0A7C5LCN5_CALS0